MCAWLPTTLEQWVVSVLCSHLHKCGMWQVQICMSLRLSCFYTPSSDSTATRNGGSAAASAAATAAHAYDLPTLVTGYRYMRTAALRTLKSYHKWTRRSTVAELLTVHCQLLAYKRSEDCFSVHGLDARAISRPRSTHMVGAPPVG